MADSSSVVSHLSPSNSAADRERTNGNNDDIEMSTLGSSTSSITSDSPPKGKKRTKKGWKRLGSKKKHKPKANDEDADESTDRDESSQEGGNIQQGPPRKGRSPRKQAFMSRIRWFVDHVERWMRYVQLGWLIDFPWRHPLQLINYFRLHLAYFVIMALIGGGIFCGTDGVTYIDGLFMATSGLAQTGLEVVDLSQWSAAGQGILCVFFLLGNPVIITLVPILIRLYRIKMWQIKQARMRRKNARARLEHFKKHKEKVLKCEIEYRALCCLGVIVPAYVVTALFVSTFAYAVYGATDSHAKSILANNHVNSMSFAVFHSISAFANCGFSLFADNFVQWQKTPYILFVTEAMVLLGTTIYPIMLRAIVWLCYLVARLIRWKSVTQALKFLLKTPRRVYTHLFTFPQTVWLLLVVIIINSAQIIFTAAFDWSNPVFNGLDGGDKVSNSIFTATTTRTAGFNSVVISQFSTAVLVTTMFMMYIAASPVHVAVRSTGEDGSNESEGDAKSKKKAADKKKKAIKSPDSEDEEDEIEEAWDNTTNSVKSQAKRVMFKDAVWVALAWLMLCIVERDRLIDDPDFTPFALLFETVSAYGTVGLSLGVSCCPYSLSGDFRVLGKLTIIAVMLLGRHRGLPDSIDKAVQTEVEVEVATANSESSKEDGDEEEGQEEDEEKGDMEGSDDLSDTEDVMSTDVSSEDEPTHN